MPDKSNRISIVIPAYNEEELLPQCLTAIMPQAKRLDAEVIVVNNNSTDQTVAIAHRFGAKVINESRQGYVFALDNGVRHASGEFIAVTDADTVVSPDWLECIQKNFNQPGVAGITGPTLFKDMLIINWIEKILPCELWGSNMAFRKSSFLQVGGFDLGVNISTEIILHHKLEKLGKIIYDKKLQVTTSSRRYQKQPLRQTAVFVTNYVWLKIFHRPLFWNFCAIRDSSKILKHKARQHNITIGAAIALLVMFYFAAWPQSTVFGQIAVRPTMKDKMVALTFDDGPNGQTTRTIVNILKKNNVPATFFEVGRSIQADPSTARFVAANGFVIGNHTWSHSFKLPAEQESSVRNELTSTTNEIIQVTGEHPTLFRLPHGWRSPQLLLEAHKEHLKIVGWSVDPKDYMTSNSKEVTEEVIEGVKPGSIVLLHDGLQDGPWKKRLLNRQATIEALPNIINALRQKGYTFVTVDQLLKESQKEESQEVGLFHHFKFL